MWLIFLVEICHADTATTESILIFQDLSIKIS